MLTPAQNLRIEHAAMMDDARAILDKPGATAADALRAEAIMAKADPLLARAKALERVAEARADLGLPARTNEFNVTTSSLAHRTVAQEIDFIRAVARGDGPFDGQEMPAEHRAEYNRRLTQPQAAGSEGGATAGGFTVAPAFLDQLLIAMKAQGGMRAASHTFTTTTGAPLSWPELDDRAQSGRLLTNENVQLNTGADLLFGAGTLGAYTFVSDVLPVSNQLMQDSAFDMAALMAAALGSRLARAENPYFTSGTGVGQPAGILTSATVGVTGATGSATTVSADNLYDLVASVDPVYRRGASFMLADTTLQCIRKLKDNAGRYLHDTYDDPTNSGRPIDTILGYPVVINPDMPAMVATAKSILFGNFSNYKIRTVVDLRLIVLRERYADVNQTGFIAAIRSDGKLISAAQPIKAYQNSAT